MNWTQNVTARDQRAVARETDPAFETAVTALTLEGMPLADAVEITLQAWVDAARDWSMS